MKPADLLRLAACFVRTRWMFRFGRRAVFEAWQQCRLERFLRQQLPRSPFYRAHAGKTLDQLPIVDKQVALAHFDTVNTAGISLEAATQVALAGEVSRDFGPGLGEITVGLSSGTQGPRGVFLVSRAERARWAGVMVARVLPASLLRHLLPGAAPVRVAFFLRANSQLYTTLDSKRVDFRFYDLLDGVDGHLPALAHHAPHVIAAPSRILARIAQRALDGSLRMPSPRRVIAVAEVLEPDDRALIERAFGGPVHQLYQCTEGFLGYTCEAGVLHLNEEFVHVEPEWLDAGKTRFVPIITDFSRTTQLMIRYRLNDVLKVRKTPCSCGRVTLALDAVEGRCDDVLWLPGSASGVLEPLFPDMVRHAVTAAPIALPDYRISQHGMRLHVSTADGLVATQDALAAALRKLITRHRLSMPTLLAAPFVGTDDHAKRRRIVCVERPDVAQSAPANPAPEPMNA